MATSVLDGRIVLLEYRAGRLTGGLGDGPTPE